MQLIVMAWRNLWRNWKRSLITIAAVVMAVILSTIMSSMQEGTYVKMIDNVVKFYSGYVQVFKPGYWETRSIDEIYKSDAKLLSNLESNPHITSYTPRLESFTLMSLGDNTKGSALIGIDPERENTITNLKRWVSKGNYLQPNDEGVLLAENLAKNLKANIGDTIVLMSQGYHGESAAMIVPLRGILHFPSPQLNSFAAYISLSKAQEFFSAPELITSLVLMVKEYKEVDKVKKDLSQSFGHSNEIMSWSEMQPELIQMIEGDRAGGIVMKVILYLVIGFGILGTVIMMMSERKKELGITVAVGMQKHTLAIMLFFETLFIALTGIIIGFMLSIPLIYYFESHPIALTGKIADAYQQFGIEPAFYFTMMPKIFIQQIIIVFCLTLLIGMYPVVKTFRMQVIKSIRG
jgi:putative ABC transport system permease protein